MHLQVEEPKAFGSYVHLDLKKSILLLKDQDQELL